MNEQISKEANDRIQKIIADTQLQQDLLLKDASARSLEINSEYNARLKEFLQDLDASKASNLAALERDLNFRQEQLLESARASMDSIHQDATQKKIDLMQNAQRKVLNDVDQLTEQVKELGEAEVERRMQSKTTTVITTETSTSPMPAAVVGTTTNKSIVQSHGVAKEQQSLHAGEARSANITRI
jgi:hypothetical protein